MKGIILAGGSGTRLYPCTLTASKQLQPVYDKPLVYYPLSTLMLAGLRDLLLISTPHDLPRFQALLGDGSRLGIRITYKEQPRPEGIAQAFLLAEEFLAGSSACLILGDNIFFGHGLPDILREAARLDDGGLVFGYWVQDPSQYGVLAFDKDGKVTDIVEKPRTPPSSYAVPGIYFYGPDVVEQAKRLRPSARGELEITDLNRLYLHEGRLQVRLLGRGFAWLDTGTHDTMLDAANFIATLERRQGLKIGCPEEVAWTCGYISSEKFRRLIDAMPNNSYAAYLRNLLRTKERP